MLGQKIKAIYFSDRPMRVIAPASGVAILQKTLRATLGKRRRFARWRADTAAAVMGGVAAVPGVWPESKVTANDLAPIEPERPLLAWSAPCATQAFQRSTARTRIVLPDRLTIDVPP